MDMKLVAYEIKTGSQAMLNLQKLTTDLSVEELRKANSGSPICMRMFLARNMNVISTGLAGRDR